MNNPTSAVFDRELKLEELLGGLTPNRLQTLLTTLLGEPVALLDAQGTPLLTESLTKDTPRTPLRWQLDTVAWLASDAAPEQCKAAAALVEQIFFHSARYRMAADLHSETQQADYEKLQQQHAALQRSEAQYRELSVQLEQRVAEQVQTIETAQRNLFYAEKMAAIGQLAAGVAHEINNPTGFIRSNLNTAQEYVEQLQYFGTNLVQVTDAAQAWQDAGLDEVLTDFPQLLRESSDGAQRISNIVTSLRTAAEFEHCEESLVDINELVRASCQLGVGNLGADINLSLQLGELPTTRCYPGQLEQACLHLLLNAAQACANTGADAGSESGTGSEIHVTTTCEYNKTGEHNEIGIHIRDNGCGIAADALPRVFEPFYTTREVGQGTGLGLSVCRDIVQAHGGRIEIASQPGAGTTVDLYLPVRD